MIRYIPRRSTVKASIRDEEIFDSVEDMISHLFDHFSRVSDYLQSDRQFNRDDIIIDNSTDDPYYSVLDYPGTVFIKRITNTTYPVPYCIGFFGEC